MFWGKHFDRVPPVESAPTSFSDQIYRVREVHVAHMKQNRIETSPNELCDMLGLPQPRGSEGTTESPTPSTLDFDQGTLGRYPLRLVDAWFVSGSCSTTHSRQTLGDLLEASFLRHRTTAFPSHQNSRYSPDHREHDTESTMNRSTSSVETADSDFMSAASSLSSPNSISSPPPSFSYVIFSGELPSFDV